MRIVELAAFHVRIPLKRRIRHASYTRTFNDTLIVRCRLDDGSIGWGEGLPRPYVTGETIDTAWQHLSGDDLPAQLAGRFDNFPEAISLLDALVLPRPQEPEIRDCFGHSVRCALELSILDAAGRALQQPLSALASHVPETIGIRQTAETVRYSTAITSMSSWKQAASAALFRLYGFQHCKVKVGAAGSDDAAALGRIRRILGPRIDLRIDANEAWSCANFLQKLEPLLPFEISAVEQPVPHAEVGGLARLKQQTGVPIMLDESLCSLSDGRRAIEEGLCDLFNIRISKCGGFVNSLRLAALAHRAGLGYQLGCLVGETGILSAAGRHFAASIGGIRYLEGSYDRRLVRERLTVEDLTFGRGGLAPALTGSGLGVTISETQVRSVLQRELVIRPRS